MSKYSKKFKNDALTYYYELEAAGFSQISIDGFTINSVNALCNFLNISKYSLYKWKDELEVEDDNYECFSFDPHEYPPHTYRDKPQQYQEPFPAEGRKWSKAFTEGKIAEETELLKPAKEDRIHVEPELVRLTQVSKSPENEKDIFGIRYYSWFAKNKHISNYSRMNLNELKMAIAEKLISECKGDK